MRRKAFVLRKVPGESNPADLCTKHIESEKKLHSLVKLFACEFREGRPEAAPALKRAQKAAAVSGSADSQARLIDLERLPHQHPRECLDEDFLKAHVQEAPEGEPDHTPEHELADPIPMLEAKAVSGKKAARSPGCTAQPQSSPSTRAKE